MDIKEALEELKGKKVEWCVFGGNSTVRFEAKLKEVQVWNYLSHQLIIKFYKGALQNLTLDEPFSYEKTETDKVVVYKIYSIEKRMIALVGYSK